MNQAAACADTAAARLHDLLSIIDSGQRRENRIASIARELSVDDGRYIPAVNRSAQDEDLDDKARGAISIQRSWMYANSRLPPKMVPFKVWTETWRIFCKAADASVAVYQRPKRDEKEDYIEASMRHGTKAMVLKSVPLDDSNLIVIAIRGSQWNVFDWATNFTVAPTEPVDFLDDQGNLCHEGFLQVARSMVHQVSVRLRELIEQDPSRVSCSLLFTGHSAGGAVANLLFMHMLSKTVSSELTNFNGVFKRVHCVTFGVPPISLLPLQKPAGARTKDLFASFINEGDPIVRADFAYMKSLIKLFAKSAPQTATASSSHGIRQKMAPANLKVQGAAKPSRPHAPTFWPVPEATLSNAGRLVLLREKPTQQRSVEAVCVSDSELRGSTPYGPGIGVVFGDPMMHHMDVYQRRVKILAAASVTGDEH